MGTISFLIFNVASDIYCHKQDGLSTFYRQTYTYVEYVVTNRMACEHPDIVSAAISVGGPLEVTTNDLP